LIDFEVKNTFAELKMLNKLFPVLLMRLLLNLWVAFAHKLQEMPKFWRIKKIFAVEHIELQKVKGPTMFFAIKGQFVVKIRLFLWLFFVDFLNNSIGLQVI